MTLKFCQVPYRFMRDLDGEADRIVLVGYYRDQEGKSVLVEVSYRTEMD